jgi:hypothetical protein
MEGFMFSITMIWAFPLTGWLADRAGWLPTFGVGGALLVVALVCWLIIGLDEPPATASAT